MATSAEVDVANEACGKFGAGEIATFDDVTQRGRAIKRVYFRVVNAILSSYPWQCCRQVLQLTPVNAPLMADNYLMQGWRYAYALPAIGVGPNSVLAAPTKYLFTPNRADGAIHAFEVQSGIVYCNEQTCYAQVQQAAPPPSWQPYLRRAIVDSLAYELVIPVSGNSGLRGDLKLEAVGTPEEEGRGGSLGLAMLADSRNDSSGTLGASSPLIDARYS